MCPLYPNCLNLCPIENPRPSEKVGNIIVISFKEDSLSFSPLRLASGSSVSWVVSKVHSSEDIAVFSLILEDINPDLVTIGTAVNFHLKFSTGSPQEEDDMVFPLTGFDSLTVVSFL